MKISRRLISLTLPITWICLSCQTVEAGPAWCQTQTALSPQPKEDNELVDTLQYLNTTTGSRQILTGRIIRMDRKYVHIEVRTKSVRRIARDSVISFDLGSRPRLKQAKALALRGQFSEAALVLETIINDKPLHPWLKRLAAIDRIECLAALGKFRIAARDFVLLAGSDTKSIPWQSAPLSWTHQPANGLTQTQASDWLKSKNPVEALLGASIGLSHPSLAGRSKRVLKNLQTAKLPAASQLATAQMWRAEIAISAAELKRREDLVATWPTSIQAGPRIWLAQQQRRAKSNKKAAVEFIRVATLFPDQHRLVLLGLDGAYLTLKDLQDPQAEIIADWLVGRFPNSHQAASIGRGRDK